MTLTGAVLPHRTSSDTEKQRSSEDSSVKERSTGRGGVGNFSLIDSEEEEDFTIPALKAPICTLPRFTIVKRKTFPRSSRSRSANRTAKSVLDSSGRGGTGNMQENDFEHPEYARAAQDVEMVPRRPSASDYHGGRSGAGNIFSPSDDEYTAAEEYEERVKYDRTVPVDHSRHDYRGWADKGKDFLFKRRK